MTAASLPAARTATRLAFLIAGFGIACWAPLVPFAKQRLGVDDAALGLLLLCIGVGSVAAMVVTGAVSARWGSRPVVVAGGLGLALVLPFLALATTPATLAVALLGFGAALGAIDVAMNIHAVEVERASGVPMMSGFHALFSIGGFAGASVTTLLLSLGVDPRAGTVGCAAAMAAAVLVARPRLIDTAQSADAPLFVRPRGIVILLSVLAAAIFLAEGAMLDWSALLIADAGLLPASRSGLGYILFSVAMTVGRLGGDAATERVGDRRVLIWGGSIAVAGFVVLLAAPLATVALAGFLAIGLGASNIVPILFRRAGAQPAMPPALAIGAVTTIGYAGILAGPAGIGFVAQHVGLTTAFWTLAALVCLVPLTARFVASAGSSARDR